MCCLNLQTKLQSKMNWSEPKTLGTLLVVAVEAEMVVKAREQEKIVHKGRPRRSHILIDIEFPKQLVKSGIRWKMNLRCPSIPFYGILSYSISFAYVLNCPPRVSSSSIAKGRGDSSTTDSRHVPLLAFR
ncbi:hypothetical protein FNV43_RR00344 [Rhamnella rubrinervis]|uniref:Uncharacterized protein n=1 Tax=Rhamnella rubrinervis TaxID=2594499 RepID=A0A8K0HMQ2_9ROSA|nr:hypothetical protein FNV43_RR00344 [Rhamnella rubrinervis]